MGRAQRQRRDDDHVRGHDGTGAGSANLDVTRLRRSFAEFRRQHKSRTRLPETLRALALAAVESGTSEQEVRRACGVTSEQLSHWRKHRRPGTGEMAKSHPKARVYSVVDDPPAEERADSVGTQKGQSLELRLGSWAICIRQLDA